MLYRWLLVAGIFFLITFSALCAESVIIPVKVSFPKENISAFNSIGNWKQEGNLLKSSGKGYESIFPKQYSALKRISVETEFILSDSSNKAAGGICLGFHVGVPKFAWTYMYYPAENKLKLEFRKNSVVKILRQKSIELKPPYKLSISTSRNKWHYTANGQTIWAASRSGTPVVYHSGACSVDTKMDISHLKISAGDIWRPVVAFGDSITHHCRWQKYVEKEFGIGITNSGMACDNTIKALKRFDTDVLALKPKVVILFIGTNNGNGRKAAEDIEKMAAIALRHNLKVIICTAIPRQKYSRIDDLNKLLRKNPNNLTLVDWYAIMDDGSKNIRKEYGGPVHPNKVGSMKMAEFFCADKQVKKIFASIKQ